MTAGPGFISFYHAAVVLVYLALLFLQPLWHAILPIPHGAESWWLALAATTPLLFPFKGILKGSLRSMTWAGYLLMLYLIVGVMEAWSNPPQRVPALLQTALVALYIYGMLRFSKEDR